VATARTATEGNADPFDQRPQPARCMGVTLSQKRGLLDEGLAWALRQVAAKPADSQLNDRLPTGDRQVAEIALVTTVERF